MLKATTKFSLLHAFQIDHKKQNPEREYMLRVSAIEIYNEIVRDLLVADSGALRLLDDPEVRIFDLL